ncbi:hypothetical protein [Bacillus manliponensis]|nr:hypothetical protein [Bacillus manliponensis]
MDLFIGIALVLIIFFSTHMIEKHLKSIKEQNDTIIKLLTEINKKKS